MCNRPKRAPIFFPSYLIVVMIVFTTVLSGCVAVPKQTPPGIESFLPSKAYVPQSVKVYEPRRLKNHEYQSVKDHGLQGIADNSNLQKAAPLTLDDCLRISLSQNPLNQAAKEGIAIADEMVGEVSALYYPEIGLTAGYSRWQRYAFLPNGISRPGMSNTIGPTDDWTAGLRARFTLFDSGERRARLTGARAMRGAAEEESGKIRQNIVHQVTQAFYNLGLAEETRATAKENLSRAEDHLRLAKERKELGAVPQADVIRAQTEVAEAGLALVRAENFVRVAEGNLNTSMGLPVETRPEVAAEPEKVISPDSIDIREALDMTVRARPVLRAALERLTLAGSEVSSARSAFGPRIKAEGGYGFHSPEFLPDEEEWSVGVTVEWPIFTGFSRKHRLARVKSELSKEEAEVRQLVLKVRQEVWSAYSKLKETYEAIQAAEVQVTDARESLRLVRERYQAGAGTISALLDTETALIRAEAALLEAKWDYLQARTSFQRAVGRLDKQI